MIPIAWLAPLAAAAVHEVGGSGYPTVEDALAVAVSGDVLRIRAGAWSGSHTISDPNPGDGLPFVLTLEPWPGESVTLTSTSANGFVHVHNGAAVTIRDLAIDGSGQRAARVTGGAALTLSNVEAYEAVRNGSGGAVSVEDAGTTLTVEGGGFRDSWSTGGNGLGGAIYVGPGASATIRSARFEGNQSNGGGGAIWCVGTCSVSESVFVGNSAGGAGGAILVQGPGFELDGTWFCANTAAQQAGAVALVGASSAEPLGHNVFFGNVASQQGGALYSDSAVTLYNSDFLANRANQQGSAVYATGAVPLVNAIVAHHTGSQQVFYGPGLAASEVTLFMNSVPVVEGNATIADEQVVDPGYVAYVAGSCESSDLRLQVGSPALAIGDPTWGDHHGAMGPACVPAAEIPGDDIDQDCNGVDACYQDSDRDGVGGATVVEGSGPACVSPGESRLTGDCDDGDASRFPGNDEAPLDGLDSDCDGLELCYPDEDGDGYGHGDPTAFSADWSCIGPGVSPVDTDCEPENGAVSPGAPEQCDNQVDDDCDDEIDTDAELVQWYRDNDGDGFGTFGAVIERCDAPIGYVPVAGDCDDTDPEVNPGAEEVCDGFDQDCDDEVDEGLPTVRSFPDADGDRYGDPEQPRDGCVPEGWVEDDSDCDDSDDSVYPGALELCNGVDDDCDGSLSTCDLDGRDGALQGDEDGVALAGCGCAAGRGGAAGWLGAIALAALLRRRPLPCPAGGALG